MTSPTQPYGDVQYADPGYQKDKKKRYPIDTPDHIRAAWSYINQAKNAAFYSKVQLAQIKARIVAAAKKAGINISDEGGESNNGPQEEKGEYGMKRSYAVTASASVPPVNPPKAWFEDPKLPARTGITVTPEGQVFGHIAAWGECHRDFNECVLAPKSKMNYRPFHLGHVMTSEGEMVRAGKIVMDTRHADVRLGYAATAIHYDDTGDEIAVVRAGEDDFGIWIAGSIVPEATPAQVAKLRRSPISGDWRAVEGNLELVAALAVNVPAFPVYSMEGEERFALIAAGMIMPNLDYVDTQDRVASFTQVFAEVEEAIMSDDELSELQNRLVDLAEDEEIYEQRELAERFALLAAVEAPAAPAPAPAAAPAPAPAATPAPAAAISPDELTTMPPDQRVAYMNALGQFSVIEKPAGSDKAPQEPAPEAAPAPAPEAVPAPAAPAPPATPVA